MDTTLISPSRGPAASVNFAIYAQTNLVFQGLIARFDKKILILPHGYKSICFAGRVVVPFDSLGDQYSIFEIVSVAVDSKTLLGRYKILN